MRVVVCYPPDFSVPSMPFGALPLFNACLRRAGHEVEVLDLAAITFNELVRRPSLERYLGVLDHELGRLHDASEPGALGLRETLSRLRAIPPDLVLDAEDAVRRLRAPETFFEPERMRHDMRSIFAAVQFLGVLRPRLDPRNRDFSDALYAHLGNGEVDPWVQCYEDLLRERLTAFAPDLVALTIPFATQVTGAMQFARWIHQRFPDTRVVVGGTGVSDAEGVLLNDPRFFEYVDFAVTGEGEDALPDLAGALESGGDLGSVAALHRFEGGEIVRPSSRPFTDMNESPIPDYTGIDFGLYTIPEKIASLTTSRGCYYGKCTFCPESFRLKFRRRGSEKAWEDVRHIAEVQGIRNFMFWDPLTPPAMLQEISRRSAEEGIEINWMAQVKFDKVYTDPEYVRTLKDGGCKWLQFGFESGVQRVLDAMEKGNDLRRIEVILDRLEEAGIAVGVFWFIGFPTELEEDARETWRYLTRRRKRIDYTGYIGTFGMGHDVPVFKNPEQYRIDIVITDDGDAAYRRRDGKDWDFTHLHETYYAHNDLFMIETGTSLLYAKRRRELVSGLSARNLLGPPSFIRPPSEESDLALPDQNGLHVPDAAGKDSAAFAFVAVSGRIHRLDADELHIVEGVRGGASVRELADAATDARAFWKRLERLVDFGILSTRPMLPDETIAGDRRQSLAAG